MPSHAKQRELTVESSNSSTAGWDWPKAVTKDKGEAERVRCWFILSSHRTQNFATRPRLGMVCGYKILLTH